MATITAASAGNWSATSTWAGGVVPGNGDTADLNGKVVVMNIATIPASGTLLALKSTGAGQLTVNLSTLGTAAINATTITAGTNTSGMIVISNNGTITITGNLIGGTATGADCVVMNGDGNGGNLILVGNATGGTPANTHGIVEYSNSSGGVVTITGNLKGGSGASTGGLEGKGTDVTYTITGTITGGSNNSVGTSFGLVDGDGGGSTYTINGNIVGGTIMPSNVGVYSLGESSFTITSCNLLPGSDGQCMFPITGISLSNVTWSPANTNYIRFAGTTFPPQLDPSNIKSGVASGTTTGTYTGGGGGGGVIQVNPVVLGD